MQTMQSLNTETDPLLGVNEPQHASALKTPLEGGALHRSEGDGKEAVSEMSSVSRTTYEDCL
jgi:hypothetical protein